MTTSEKQLLKKIFIGGGNNEVEKAGSEEK